MESRWNRFGVSLGVILVSEGALWDHIGSTLVSLGGFWAHSDVTLALLRALWRHFGITFGPLWVTLGSLWNHFWPHWDHFGVTLAPFWHQRFSPKCCGADLGSRIKISGHLLDKIQRISRSTRSDWSWALKGAGGRGRSP